MINSAGHHLELLWLSGLGELQSLLGVGAVEDAAAAFAVDEPCRANFDQVLRREFDEAF